MQRNLVTSLCTVSKRKKRTENKIGDRLKTPVIYRDKLLTHLIIRACAHLKTCVACQIIASWPFVISWRHKTPIKNMKYIITSVFKLFSNIFWDEYELKEDDK